MFLQGNIGFSLVNPDNVPGEREPEEISVDSFQLNGVAVDEIWRGLVDSTETPGSHRIVIAHLAVPWVCGLEGKFFPLLGTVTTPKMLKRFHGFFPRKHLLLHLHVPHEKVLHRLL